VSGLRDQSCRLGASGLFWHGRIAYQLSQPALRAQPHLQRIRRVGPRDVAAGEIVTGGVLTPVAHKTAHFAGAHPAALLAHLTTPCSRHHAQPKKATSPRVLRPFRISEISTTIRIANSEPPCGRG